MAKDKTEVIEIVRDAWSRSFTYDNYVDYATKAGVEVLSHSEYNRLYEALTDEYYTQVEG